MKLRLPILFAVSLVALGLAAWWWFGRSKSAPAASETAAAIDPASRRVTTPAAAHPADQETRIASAVAPGTPQVRTVPRPLPVSNPDSGQPPPQLAKTDEARADVENLRLMFRDYRTRFGENPVGSNAEIMKAIMGGNPVQAMLGPPPGHSLNPAGELVDRWGTPYFFHQLSKDTMEIRSAGPDRVLWTGDDIVGR